MKKNILFLSILAVFAANSANAFDFGTAKENHKSLAKQQMLEKVTTGKTVNEAVDEHKEMAKSNFSSAKDGAVSDVNETVENSKNMGADAKSAADDLKTNINSVKSLFQ